MKPLAMTLLCAIASAAPLAAVAAPSEAHRQAAAELLEVIDMPRAMAGGAAAMTDAMVMQTPALAEFRDVLLEWSRKYITWEAIRPKMLELYVESFTERELRELTAFYKTPTGKKALAVMPELMRRGALLGSEVAQKHQKELEDMVRARAAEMEKGSKKP